MDWRLRPLALIVKLWAQYQNINDARNMTISSYSLVLMVIHFLQYAVHPAVLPCLHKTNPEKFQVRNFVSFGIRSLIFFFFVWQILHDICTIDMVEYMAPYKSDNRQTLGELFVQFMEYYSNFE